MGRATSKKQYRRNKRRYKARFNWRAQFESYKKSSKTGPRVVVIGFGTPAVQAAVPTWPSGDFKCLECMTCLICHRKQHGRKLHTNPCSFECGHKE